MTNTGSLYHLLGVLDRQKMQDYLQSLPEIASEFQYGFSRNWVQLVQMVLFKEEEKRYTMGSCYFWVVFYTGVGGNPPLLEIPFPLKFH